MDLVTLDRVIWAGIPEREEAGSPNVPGIVALAAAIRRIREIGMDNIAAHEEALTAYALEQFASLPGVEVLGPREASRRVGVLAFTIDGIRDNLAAAVLGYEWGIGVRAGCFCAHPGMSHLLRVSADQAAEFHAQIIAHVRTNVPGAVRASIGIQTTPVDLDIFFQALRAILDGKFSDVYQLDPASGEYTPPGWHPLYDTYFSV